MSAAFDMTDQSFDEQPSLGSHYKSIAAAIDLIVESYQDQPSLEDMAAAAGMSPFHFQRVFKRWAGISPKRFAQFVADEILSAVTARERQIGGPCVFATREISE